MRPLAYRKRPSRVIQLHRHVFGALTAMTIAGRSKTRKVVRWRCVCTCGREVIVDGDRLRTGRRRACGIAGHYFVRKRKPGFAVNFKSEYLLWQQIKDRCCNKKSARYRNYGKIGVQMQQEWRDDFGVFLMDVGKRPTKNHRLRRFGNTGNYEKGNVEWYVPEYLA